MDEGVDWRFKIINFEFWDLDGVKETFRISSLDVDFDFSLGCNLFNGQLGNPHNFYLFFCSMDIFCPFLYFLFYFFFWIKLGFIFACLLDGTCWYLDVSAILGLWILCLSSKFLQGKRDSWMDRNDMKVFWMG